MEEKNRRKLANGDTLVQWKLKGNFSYILLCEAEDAYENKKKKKLKWIANEMRNQ